MLQSAKKRVVSDGLFYAELNKFLSSELAEESYAGVEIKQTPTATEITIHATRVRDVHGENGRRLRELTTLIEKRFGFKKGGVILYTHKVLEKGLCAAAQCESLRYKLEMGLPVRRACFGILRYVMESGARGCEVIVSGKLRAQRAKAQKFRDGYLLRTGQAAEDYLDVATRHLSMRQGSIGIKVKIMLPQPKKGSATKAQPDIIIVNDPKL
jgi:small subunit ribosomal protein S3e